MAKKRRNSKMKKGSPAAKAWGRRMKALRAKGNPSRKRRKKRNPYYKWSGEVPVTRKFSGRSKKFLSAADREGIKELASIYGDSLNKGIDAYLAEPSNRRNLLQKLGMDNSAHSLRELKSLVRAQTKTLRSLKRANSAASSAERKADQIRKSGGTVDYMANPKRRRKKHRKHKKHAKRRRKHKMHMEANPRRKRRKQRRHAGAKRHHRRKRRHSYAGHQHSKLRRGGKFRLRRASISGIVNPMINVPSIKHTLWLAGGYVAAIGVFKALDSLSVGPTAYTGSNGIITGQLAALVPAGLPAYVTNNLPGLIAPGLGVAVGLLVKKLPMKNKFTEELADGAVVIGGAFMAVAVMSMVKGMVASFVPAGTPVLSPALSGVSYIPAGGTTDFGMYPQMGDGYRQSAGDFGIIPSGMAGINYTPRRAGMAGMGAVDYYPAGSQGNQMYPQSAAGAAAEAEGLGIIPNGMMGDADFGIIPEGMSGEGQLG